MPLLEVWASRLQRGASFPRGPRDARGTTPGRFPGTHGPQASRPRDSAGPDRSGPPGPEKAVSTALFLPDQSRLLRGPPRPLPRRHTLQSSGPHPRALLPSSCYGSREPRSKLTVSHLAAPPEVPPPTATLKSFPHPGPSAKQKRSGC